MTADTATNAPAHETDDIEALSICDYCRDEFKPKRKWQKFCAEPCRRAFEKIIQKITTKLHPTIRDGVKELMQARGKKA